MNNSDRDRMNDLANKIIEGIIRPDEEQEFAHLYNLYMDYKNNKVEQ